MKRVVITVVTLLLVAAGVVAYLFFGPKLSNPCNYATVGDIAMPVGFERVKADQKSYGAYLRRLPLKPRGSKVMLYTGEQSRLQFLSYSVVDLPLISNWEQCADCCMRLRAEYLFATQQQHRIHFNDVNGNSMTYGGQPSRKALENYLKKVYGVACTLSLSRELPRRKLKDVEPGDVFVYPARNGKKYGHAITVVDVAVNKCTGKKAVLLAEGNTPACSIHVMRNKRNPLLSPWFVVDEDLDHFWASVFWFEADNLHYFKD